MLAVWGPARLVHEREVDRDLAARPGADRNHIDAATVVGREHYPLAIGRDDATSAVSQPQCRTTVCRPDKDAIFLPGTLAAFREGHQTSIRRHREPGAPV